MYFHPLYIVPVKYHGNGLRFNGQSYFFYYRCSSCSGCNVRNQNENEEKAKVILPEGGLVDDIEEARDSFPAQCIHWEER